MPDIRAMDEDRLIRQTIESMPACQGWSIRLMKRHSRRVAVRSGVSLPVGSRHDHGAMVTIQAGGGEGYAATSELSPSGLLAAAERARRWACQAGQLLTATPASLPQGKAHWQGPCKHDPEQAGVASVLERCRELDDSLRTDERVAESHASIKWVHTSSRLVSSAGADQQQINHGLVPQASVSVRGNGLTRTRSLGSHRAAQGGLEVLDACGFDQAGPRLTTEAIALLEAPPCPNDVRDVILMPSQMVLQIHESIGHPLELDRILGDERNYAGTSFVTQDMFGSYRYGSELLNVTFDPTVPGQLASYSHDDSGSPAERVHLIRNGILERPLGGALSQSRTGLAGTANSRAASWNRPAIDRMGNINVEPQSGTIDDLIAETERGILMDNNRSWSIDDSRNKFQFGCEYARLIKNGELGPVVANPGYRAISATFWRNLVGVGGPESVSIHGTPNCGKGEPNQVISTGHAAPPCRFADVEVFGGI